MTPAARYAAACDILDQVVAGHPTERALLAWARGSRYAGSKDRAAVRDIVFDAIRSWNSCAALGGGTNGRARILGLLRLTGVDPSGVFTGLGYAMDALTPEEVALWDTPGAPVADVPAWVLPEITRSLGADTQSYLDTLRHRAPVWLRVNTVRATPEQARASLARDGIATAPHPDVKGCLHVQNPKSKVHLSQSFLQGVVDLQDAASQAVIGTIPLEPGHRVLDFCAGGGGKALAMAARGVATVEAHDVNPARMADIPDRAARLGVQITCVAQPKGPYDLVLCDAPCSGSGSWRRAPDGKWTLTPDGLETLKTTQVDILGHAAKLVAKGGVLAYATCSVLRCENEETVDRFIKANPGWVCTAQTRWVMGALGDGFFIATLSHQ